MKRRILLAVMSLAVAATACRRDSKDPNAATQAGKPKVTLLAPGSRDWSKSEALGYLEEEPLGISAAIRLLRWEDATPLSVPADLTDAQIRRLRLVKLSNKYWAIGRRDEANPDRLWVPALISATGDVTYQVNDGRDELLVIYLADDPDVFPHVAIFADRVWFIREEVRPAMVLEPGQDVWFELRRQDGYPYVGLVLPRDGEDVEVAKYTWDPWERVFTGPLTDKLPDPPGGTFKLNLDASKFLIPEGGIIPEPEPIKEPNFPREPPISDDFRQPV